MPSIRLDLVWSCTGSLSQKLQRQKLLHKIRGTGFPVPISMKKYEFIYFSLILLSIPCLILIQGLNYFQQFGIAVIGFVLCGIPHGALDHLIGMREKKWSALSFLTLYVGLILVYGPFWYALPKVLILFFLLLSAYHFGQSQFTGLNMVPKVFKVALYLSWGLTIIWGLLFLNQAETAFLINDFGENDTYLSLFSPPFIRWWFSISCILCLGLLLLGVRMQYLSIANFFKELFLLGVIMISFYLLPIILGFTLFFSVIHSLKVLLDEFNYFKSFDVQLSAKSFLIKVLPLTIISVIGIIAIIFLRVNGWITLSVISLAFILVSLITLPHSITMELMYSKDSQTS